MPQGRKTKASEQEDDDDDTDYTVEEILDSKTEKGVKKYLVKWQGFPIDEATWEPRKNLNCAWILKEYDLKKFLKNKVIRNVDGCKKLSDGRVVAHIFFTDGSEKTLETKYLSTNPQHAQKLIDYYESKIINVPEELANLDVFQLEVVEAENM